MTTKYYWAVIWGDKDKDSRGEGVAASGPSHQAEALRVAQGKHATAQEACRLAFGTTSKTMWTKNLGTQVAPLRTDKHRAVLLDINRGRWVRLNSNVAWVDGKVWRAT